MARMKIEFLHHYRAAHPLTARERLVAYLPRYAPYAARARGLLDLRDRIPGLAAASERLLGFAAKRRLPQWQKPYRTSPAGEKGSGRGPRPVVLLVDTFNRWFEPENAAAAGRVLRRAGYDVVAPEGKGRPLCCGRTFLSVGLVAEARAEARRLVAALAPFVAAGVPIVGLEPSCLLTLRDELPALLPGDDSRALAAQAKLFEEFVAEEAAAGRFAPPLRPVPGKAVLHSHCHQKAFAIGGAGVAALSLVPGLAVETFDSTCCGMAGAFGYEAEHYDMSLRIGELSVLARLRRTDAADLLAASGTSCRHQIRDVLGREALHPARILDRALATDS
jgi:Fe-S oxidoreductase